MSETFSLVARLRSDLDRAAYFVFEASHERWETIKYVPLEEAEMDGFYSVTLGLADGPPLRKWQTFASFDDAIGWLQDLRYERSDLRIYLRCRDVQAEIVGIDVLRGLIEARAAVSADRDDDEWRPLAEGITSGTLALAGTSFSPFFADLAERFTA